MRNRYNLSHLAHPVGHIGRLQTISVIPVVAGDSLQLSLDGIVRLAPTRKEIVSECQVDICAFYVKHRHVWPDDWPELVKRGIQVDDEGAFNLPAGPAVDADSRDPWYLGIRTCGATINRSLPFGYNFIYRRYFAVPTTNGNGEFSFSDDDYIPLGTTQSKVHQRSYGLLAARLPHILNGPVIVNAVTAAGDIRNYAQADWGIELQQDNPGVGVTLFDIRDLKSIQSRYRSIQEQNYFAQFYNDVLAMKWDTKGVNTDADPRPDYLGRTTQFLSGTDVNGTDDATLGSFVGKTLDRINFRLPRRMFPEHGNVWIMMLLRYPLVHTKEQHPLLATSQPDPKLILADPQVWAGEPVVAFNPADWLSGGSSFVPDVDAAQQPYGQEYRYQPNRIHPVFETIPGYPFTSWDSANVYPWYYYNDNEYANTFQTSQIAQWQAHMSVSCTKFSTIIDPKSSIFAGA